MSGLIDTLPERPKKFPENEPKDHDLGRSRGGFGTKIHIACDRSGVFFETILSPGQDHESTYFEELMETISVPSRRGRSKKRPKMLCGDKGYSAGHIRAWSKSRRIKAVIPYKSNEKGRLLPFDKETYRQRNQVERMIGRLKEYRRIATRYDKLSVHYHASIKIASIRNLLKTKN